MDGSGTLTNNGTVSSLVVTATTESLSNYGIMSASANVGSGSLTIQSPASLSINSVGSLTVPGTSGYGGMLQILAPNGTLNVVGGTGSITP